MFRSLLVTVPTHGNPWPFVLSIILLVILGGCDRSGDREDQRQLDALSTRLSSLETHVEGQATVLQQILDHVSPPRLSADWENRLEQVEAQVGDIGHWPKDAGEARELFDQTAGLVASLPAWAEADYLPRLTVVRWAAMAFDRLHDLESNRHSLDQLEEIVFELRDLADARPQGGSEALAERLRESAAEIAGRTVNRRVSEAIREAQLYLGGNSDAVSDIIEVYEFLEPYEEADNLVGINVNIATLRNRLYNQITRRQALEQAAALRTEWENVQQLSRVQPRPAVYEVSVRALLQQVVSAHMVLVLKGLATTAYDELESELRRAVEAIESSLAKRVEERQAQAMRSYQRWALLEIKAFEAAYDATSKKAAEDASLLRRDDGGWNDGYYNEVRLAITNRLLPINLALLELPVQERYQQAFQKGWKKLEGREDQTFVAQASALKVKKSLREFMEEG